MSTICTQKPKTKTQTTNPPLCYSTLAPNWPPVSNTPTPQPCYINTIHKHGQCGLNRGHYGDDRNLIGPLPDPIRPCQTPMPDNGSPGLSTHVNKGKIWVLLTILTHLMTIIVLITTEVMAVLWPPNILVWILGTILIMDPLATTLKM